MYPTKENEDPVILYDMYRYYKIYNEMPLDEVLGFANIGKVDIVEDVLNDNELKKRFKEFISG